MKNLRNLLKDDRGISLLQAALLIPVFFSFFGVIIDFIAIHYIKNDAKDSLTYACEAAAKKHIIKMDNTVVFDLTAASNEFYTFLQRNFQLDSSLTPLTNDTYVRDTISVDELIFIDTDTASLPYTDPNTSKVYKYPTVHAVITVPSRLFFMNLFGVFDTKVKVHVDVSTEDYP